MARYIDANKILSHLNDEIEGCGDYDVYSQPVVYGTYLGLAYARSVVETAETADVVQIVRCKDCAFWQDNNGGYPHQECRWGHGETPDPDDYCSFGESISEDYDMKIYDPKTQHINTDLADRCNHGTRE